MSFRPSRDVPVSSETLDELLSGFIAERESDHRRICGFLHDELGQVLSAVGLQLDALRLDFASRAPELEQRTGEIQQMLEPVITRVRDISNELNPSPVERVGLPSALGRLAARLQEGFAGTVRLDLDHGVRIEAPRGDALYRAAEAAAELAISAARCTQVDILLKSNRGHCTLEIRANAEVEIKTGLHLPALLMHYYASRSGISVAVNRSTERYTIIRFSSSDPARPAGC